MSALSEPSNNGGVPRAAEQADSRKSGAASIARFRDDGTGDWLTFGTHAVPVECKDEPLEFAGTGEDGMPLWERHDDCAVVLGFCDKCQCQDTVIEHQGEHVWFCFDCMEQARLTQGESDV